MPIIRMYTGSYATKVGYPTLLIANWVDEGMGIGEGFLILRKPPQMQFSLPIKRRIRMFHLEACVKLVSVSKQKPPTPEEYMFSTVFDWAKNQWEHLKFLEWEKVHEESLVTRVTEFSENESWSNAVAQLWLAGMPKDIFMQILKGTRVKELAQFMEKLQQLDRPQDEPI